MILAGFSNLNDFMIPNGDEASVLFIRHQLCKRAFDSANYRESSSFHKETKEKEEFIQP